VTMYIRTPGSPTLHMGERNAAINVLGFVAVLELELCAVV